MFHHLEQHIHQSSSRNTSGRSRIRCNQGAIETYQREEGKSRKKSTNVYSIVLHYTFNRTKKQKKTSNIYNTSLKEMFHFINLYISPMKFTTRPGIFSLQII